MAIETKFSVEDITVLLRESGWWDKRTSTMIPNLSWGLLNHEADFCVIKNTGYLTEIEIKRSFEDLKKDFKKDVFHDDDRVSRFYYCLPISLKERAENLFEEQKEKLINFYGCEPDSVTAEHIPAVIYYDEEGKLTTNGGWPERLNTRKLFLEERDKIGRLMSLRYWDVVTKHNKMLNDMKEKNGYVIEF